MSLIAWICMSTQPYNPQKQFNYAQQIKKVFFWDQYKWNETDSYYLSSIHLFTNQAQSTKKLGWSDIHLFVCLGANRLKDYYYN